MESRKYSSNLFCKITKRKILKVTRERLTFKIDFVNFKTKEVRALWLQFSLKDPWFIPRYEKHFGEVDIPLAGWLFFYIGIANEGLICENNSAPSITGPDGKNYSYAAFPKREDADYYHNSVKKGKQFFIFEKITADGNREMVVRQEKSNGKLYG